MERLAFEQAACYSPDDKPPEPDEALYCNPTLFLIAPRVMYAPIQYVSYPHKTISKTPLLFLKHE